MDLIFLLLAPEHAGADHLKALARISRLLREPQSIERLRARTRPSGALFGPDAAGGSSSGLTRSAEHGERAQSYPPTMMRHQANGAKPCRLTKSSR